MPFPDLTGAPLASLFRLDGRVAVVTGGARGIGRAISRRLSEAGALVVVADIDDDAAGVTAAAISVEGGVATEARRVDVSDPASLDRLAKDVVRQHGQIDIWVNNAGVFPMTDFLGNDERDWDRVMDLNARGAYLGARAAARESMIPRGSGVIINLTSTNSFRAFGPGIPHYTASKHACLGITRSLAVELGEHGIRVVSLSPTQVETEGILGMRAEAGPGFAEEMATMVAAHASGRVALPDDVARCAVFLASDMAMMVTGSDIKVDGGFLAR